MSGPPRPRGVLQAGLFAALFASCTGLLGCGPATYNVRAARAYANEDTNRAVVDDRVAEMEKGLQLAELMLTQTPYSPGDAWVKALRLDDDEGDRLRDLYEDKKPYDGEYELPIAKLYRIKLDEARVVSTRPRSGKAEHPSLFDAAARLSLRAKGLLISWPLVINAQRTIATEELRLEALAWGRPLGAPDSPEMAVVRAKITAAREVLASAQQGIVDAANALRSASVKSDQDALVARDLLHAITFVQRMHIEALAMAPYVVKQAKRVARETDDYGPTVTRARLAQAVIDEEQKALDVLASALVVPARMPLDDAAGYQMHEGLIEQAAIVNLDASHFKIKNDFDVLFFNEVASAGASGGENDYTGRTRRLSYNVEPLFMLGARGIITYDFLHVKNAASLNAGFRTNRLWSKGGDLGYTSSLGELVGLDGLVSDFFDIGTDLMGFNTSVKFATFTSGTVSEVAVDPVTGKDVSVVGTAPFQLSYQQIDVGFDTTKLFPDEAEDMYIESLLVGFRYMHYELPRIFYVLSQPDTSEARYVLDRQSPPQSVASQFYKGGFAIRLGNGEWPRLSPYLDLAVYGGAGPVSYYFTEDPTVAGGTRENHDATMIGLSGNAALGARLRLTSYRSRPRLVIEGSYQVEGVGQGIISNIRGVKNGDSTSYVVDKKVDLGGFDLFHGPRLLAVIVF